MLAERAVTGRKESGRSQKWTCRVGGRGQMGRAGEDCPGAPAKILKGERLGCSLGHGRGDRDRGALAREGR